MRNRFFPPAINSLADERDVVAAVEKVGKQVEQRARQNARVISPHLADAITAMPPASDSKGSHVDIGYDKAKPGFALWWHEVGTVNNPATPHLRPAISPR